MLENEKSINFSDSDLLAELSCQASHPEDEEKTKLFLKYTGLAKLEKQDGLFSQSKDRMFNVKELEASAKYFYNFESVS